MTRSRRGSRSLVILATLTLAVVFPAVVRAQAPSVPFTATSLIPESVVQNPAEKLKPAARTAGAGQGLISVIVKLRGEPLASYRGGVPGLRAPRRRAEDGRLRAESAEKQAYLAHLASGRRQFEARAAAAVPKARFTHRFDVILNAVAMIVPADEVHKLAVLPGVEAVIPDELLHPDTEHSPQFIGAPAAWTQLGGQGSAGEGVVVGVLDTGIWPEHPSFSDPDPAGKPYGVPPGWNGTACDFGNTAHNPTDAPFTCNSKLLGAARFMTTYDALVGIAAEEFGSARDDNGHGTHTSSTAAGNGNVAADIFDIPRGKVSGVAPRASVAMYKVCGDLGCYGSDSAAAVQQAILDGADVINFSISGGRNPYADVVSLAFLDAYNAGLLVAASAGNSGPGPDTVDHREPWVATVAASTQDRSFTSTASLTSNEGDTLALGGASVTAGINVPKGVVVPASDPFCLAPFAPGSVADQIVVCQRGGGAGRAEKGYNVLQGGAAGMILYNNAPTVTDLETDSHFLPAIHVQHADGQALLAFVSTHTGVAATLTAGARVTSPGDVMASFSSRGGPGQTLGVSKPDITAPGVQILAGHSPLHFDIAGGPDGELFQAIAGTSMASPHVAGAGALLKALNPGWTPGMIRSALMLTAKTAGISKEDGITAANAFDRGSGRVNLTNAWKSWLTMDATGAEFVALRNELWRANYPSVYVPSLPGIITVQRTVRSELPFDWWMTLRVSAPSDVKITVPAEVFLPANGTATFAITIDARKVPLGATRMGAVSLVKNASYPVLRIPVTFVRAQAVVTLAKVCDPAVFPQGSATACTITASNTSFSDASVSVTDSVPARLKVLPGTVVGATSVLGNAVGFVGTLAGGEPPGVAIGPGSSPAGGYLPLSLFGIAPIGGVGDESLVNFNVPAFTYAGETYTSVGVGSNGYVVVGGGTTADVTFLNQNLPSPVPPNNVLAPFWTDLNPAAGGALRIGILTDGANSWLVVDWDAVREYSAARFDSFEIWIGLNGDASPGEDISFAYGPLGGNGDLGFLTVGAENRYGNRGGTSYYNGAGTLPADGTQLRVTGTPSAPGETHVVSFQAKGMTLGAWTNYVLMTSNLFEGTSVASFSGEVR